MFSTGESLEDIEKWAMNAFPSSFTKVKDYIKHSKLTTNRRDVTTNRFVNAFKSQKVRLFCRSVTVGATTEDHLLVFASLYPMSGALWMAHEETELIKSESNHSVSNVSSKDARHIIRHIDPSCPETTYNEPFRWMNPGDDEVGAARLEAFVQYLFLMQCQDQVEKLKVNIFKEHFEGACRDIAEGLAHQAREAGTIDRVVRLKYKSQPVIAHDVSQPLTELVEPVMSIATGASIEPTAPATATSEHTLAIDDILARLKSSFEEQVKEAWTAARQENEQLRAQNRVLELRAISAEDAQTAYRAEAATATAKIIAAQEEVRKAAQEVMERKRRFDELKRTLEDTIASMV